MNSNKKTAFIVVMVLIAAGVFLFLRSDAQKKGETSSVYAMDTMISQKAYGANAKTAMEEVNKRLLAFEEQVSMYMPHSDIAAINNAAGKEPVKISEEVFELLSQAKQLSQSSDNSFAVTIAPLSIAWGITSQSPRVVPESEREQLLQLVGDDMLQLENGTAFLPKAGQGIDLGGIAKGTACDIAKEIYEKNKVKSALLNLGGSCIYVKGLKPDGTETRVGFRDPLGGESASIASFTFYDAVFSTSGGYERFFEEEGIKYHHILDIKTGAPANSDISSVGVLCENGTEADFLSTSLYVRGLDATLEYMKNGGTAIALDINKNLYVSKALEKSFELIEKDAGYTVKFI